MNKLLKSVIVLSVICAVVSVLLAFTNHITKDKIKENENAATDAAMKEVLPEGETFEPIIDLDNLPESVVEAYDAKEAGYVIKVSVTGYQPNMIIICGIDNDGVVVGTKYFSGGETHPAKDTYGANLLDKTIQDIGLVETISGSTMTSAAYKKAVTDALNAFAILNGGTADNRTPEEILSDNLNAALPEANGKFEPVLLLESFEGIDNVHKALGGQGYVFIVGKNFIATDSKGKVLTETDDETKATVEAAATAIIGWDKNEIDLSSITDMPTQVKRAYKTEDGNYTLILNAAGYGINGGDQYHQTSGKYIVIKVTATKNGEILSCVTLSQGESQGYGDACADEKFYSQFNGKTESNYSEIDAISGATMTTNAYKTAISKVFEAIKLLKGVS